MMLKELCPDRYRTLLEEMAEEEAVRDVHVRGLGWKDRRGVGGGA